MTNPLHGWHVDLGSIGFVGRDLQRPECILAEPDGTLWTADARGGVVRIAPDGSQQLIAQHIDTRFADADSVDRYTLGETLPNGLAFAPNGDLLIADFGRDTIDRMTRSGDTTVLLAELDGVPLGKTNFVLTDSRGRIWFTVTTRLHPWTRSINERRADGYVGLIDGEHGARIVADGFVGTNEIRFDEAEEWLYVVESNARRITRLRALPDGALVDREVYGPPDLGGIPDGFAFDAPGNLWITLVNADRLVALTPEGELLDLLDDGDPARVAEWDRHFHAGTMTPEILSSAAGSLAPMMASVTFGGPDLRTVYLDSLMGTTISVPSLARVRAAPAALQADHRSEVTAEPDRQTQPNRLEGGDALARTLVAIGIQDVFGVPAVSLEPFLGSRRPRAAAAASRHAPRGVRRVDGDGDVPRDRPGRGLLRGDGAGRAQPRRRARHRPRERPRGARADLGRPDAPRVCGLRARRWQPTSRA